MRSLRKNKRLRKSTKRNFRKRKYLRSYKKHRYSRLRNMRGGSLQTDWVTKASSFFTNPSKVVQLIQNSQGMDFNTLKQQIIKEVGSMGQLQQLTRLLIERTTDSDDLVKTLNELVNVPDTDPHAGLETLS